MGTSLYAIVVGGGLIAFLIYQYLQQQQAKQA